MPEEADPGFRSISKLPTVGLRLTWCHPHLCGLDFRLLNMRTQHPFPVIAREKGGRDGAPKVGTVPFGGPRKRFTGAAGGTGGIALGAPGRGRHYSRGTNRGPVLIRKDAAPPNASAAADHPPAPAPAAAPHKVPLPVISTFAGDPSMGMEIVPKAHLDRRGAPAPPANGEFFFSTSLMLPGMADEPVKNHHYPRRRIMGGLPPAAGSSPRYNIITGEAVWFFAGALLLGEDNSGFKEGRRAVIESFAYLDTITN
ncbi:hypothetical protein BDK51DRAFT_28617, partial [Blyttiomyces helicus]